MDELLAREIVKLNVPQFGPNQKNKGDSPSCRFEPRHLLSSPDMLRYIGERLADIAKEQCNGSAIVGMATSGIAWASLASAYSGLPMLYVRKTLEADVSEKMLEGLPPPEGSLILIDDLIFDGRSKRASIETLQELGFNVSDVVVIIDRQLQRKDKGPSLEKAYNVKLHSLITMTEVVDYMIARDAITPEQLQMLIEDYTRFDRWTMPGFASGITQPG